MERPEKIDYRKEKPLILQGMGMSGVKNNVLSFYEILHLYPISCQACCLKNTYCLQRNAG